MQPATTQPSLAEPSSTPDYGGDAQSQSSPPEAAQQASSRPSTTQELPVALQQQPMVPPPAVGGSTPPGPNPNLHCTPSRHQQSVGTQHDEQTYAQWFYTEVRPLTTPSALPQVNVGGPQPVKRRRSGHSGNGGVSSFVSGSTVVTDPNHLNLITGFMATNDFTPDRRVPAASARNRRRRREHDAPATDDDRHQGDAPPSASDDTTQSTDCSDTTEGHGDAVFSDTDSATSAGLVMGIDDSNGDAPPVLLDTRDAGSAVAGEPNDEGLREHDDSADAALGTNQSLAGEPAHADDGGLQRPLAVGEDTDAQTPLASISTATSAPHVPHNPQHNHPTYHDTKRTEHHPAHTTQQPNAQHDGAAPAVTTRQGSSGPVNFVMNCLCPPSLAAELEAYALLRLQLRQDEQRDRNRYISLIERVVQNVLGKRATVTVHGSFATGVALQSSDIDVLVRNYEPIQPLVAIERVSNALFTLESYDIPDLSGCVTVGTPAAGTPVTLPTDQQQGSVSTTVVDFPSDPQQRQRSEGTVSTSPVITPSSTPTTSMPHQQLGAGSLFDPSATITRHGQILSVQTIVATRVPVVKVREILTAHRCDVSFGGGEHFPSMELTKSLLSRHPSSRSLLLLLKYVVKKMQIGETEPGGITSFPLYLLAIHFYEHGLVHIHQMRHGGAAAVSSPPASGATTTTSTVAAASVSTKSPQQQQRQQEDDARRQMVQDTLHHALGSTSGTPQPPQQRIVDTIGSYLYGAQSDEREPVVTPPLSGHAEGAPSETLGGLPNDASAELPADPLTAPSSPVPLTTSPPPPPPIPPLQQLPSSAAAIEASLSIGQVILDFCIYYAYIFEYERSGLRFAPDGTSSVVDKPPQCNARGQHLHMTGPFDPRADITARMAHTREFQAMCGGIATILSGGTLTHLLTWVSPETIHDDLHAVYHYLHTTMPHLYPAAAVAAAAASSHQAAVYQHQQHQQYNAHHHRHHGNRHHHPSSAGVGGGYNSGANNNGSINVLVGGGQGRMPRHHGGATGGHNGGAFGSGGAGMYQDPAAHHNLPTLGGGGGAVPLPTSVAEGHVVAGGAPTNNASRGAPQHLVGIGYVNPYARSNTPGAGGYQGNSIAIAQQQQQHMAGLVSAETPPYASMLQHHHSVGPGVTTGTMTSMPQAPPLQPPPLQGGSSSNSSRATVAGNSPPQGMYVNALMGGGGSAPSNNGVAFGAAHLHHQHHHHQHHHHHHHHIATFATPSTQVPPPASASYVQAALPGYATVAQAATVPHTSSSGSGGAPPSSMVGAQPPRRPSFTGSGSGTTAAAATASVMPEAPTAAHTTTTTSPAPQQPLPAEQPQSSSTKASAPTAIAVSRDEVAAPGKGTTADPSTVTAGTTARAKSKAKKAAAAAKSAAAESAAAVGDLTQGASSSATAASGTVPAAAATSAPQRQRHTAPTAAAVAQAAAASAPQPGASANLAAAATTTASKKKKKKTTAPAAEGDASLKPPTESQTSNPPAASSGSRRGGDVTQQRQPAQSSAASAPPASTLIGTQTAPVISPALIPPASSPLPPQATVTVSDRAATAAKYVPPFRRMQLEEQQRQGPAH